MPNGAARAMFRVQRPAPATPLRRRAGNIPRLCEKIGPARCRSDSEKPQRMAVDTYLQWVACMAEPPLERIVYGPVRSRRLGMSLGVNLLPAGTKVCNMNCVYCQYGWTRGAVRYRGQGAGWPSAQAVEAAVVARLTRAAETNEIIDRITVAGHGEPTLNPEFEAISGRLRAVRDRIVPGLPLAILSNSTTAGLDDVWSGLECYDDRYMKLDAGDPLTYACINGARIPLAFVVDALTRAAPIVVQAMFVSDAKHVVENCGSGAVAEWIAAVKATRARRVHLYTLDRSPALSSLRAVPRRRLREIAEQVRAAGIPADVFAERARPTAPL
jgi:wyosine [tRNA(Phe)-imidazoG37] synthetase (radical SAM superfamily)